MQKGLIGVIVPVYKVEKYIAECIESILAQTYTKFRLILIDDGTPDNAGKICEEYAKKDPRITVIHQENTGVTRARARGVQEATDCEFIIFIDSDDTITPDALQAIHSSTNDNIDIVLTVFDKNHIPPQEHITNIQYRHWAVENLYYIGAACGKLIRRTLLNDFVFDIPSYIKIHEDTIMNIRIAFNANNNIFFCNKAIYNYRYNESSVTHTIKKDLKYEGILHEHIKASIPPEDHCTYIKHTIRYRFVQWCQYCLYKYNINDIKNENFYLELRKDIVKYKFRLKLFERLSFFCTNPLLRHIIISVKNGTKAINRAYHKVFSHK